MYIRKIKIKNYRNFSDFSMKFRKGLNVIIGSNNSGKTGLLYAIRLLSDAKISVHDFNKNDLLGYSTKYLDEPPSIEIEYEIQHEISEDNTDDESIIKLVPFLGMNEFEESRNEDGGCASYTLVANVKMTFVLESKATSDYKAAVKGVTSFDGFVSVLETFLDRFEWTFTNSVSEMTADKKYVTGIFDIRFIKAERTNKDVHEETKREIAAVTKEQKSMLEIQKLKQTLADGMRVLLDTALKPMSDLIENENNDIGLRSGGISIFQDIRPTVSVADSYVTDVKDTKGDFIVPLGHNGLGYNNLINIYILIRLNELRKGKDFRILCLEEPEAHLHPAMQYKLFKFLRDLDKENKLNQQIFVTTHSSNISAVAGIDNMYMLDYSRGEDSDCRQQSLEEHFANKQDAKKHLTKFLDVTRSDMLFADRVILVEGIAEKLLLPLFMNRCGYSYEDGHISIVEIGGKHFEHFIELFNENAVKKKVLCITDKDFKWITEEDTLSVYSEYEAHETPHIEKLKERFDEMSNLKIVSQNLGGTTFEDELLLANFGNYETVKTLLELAVSKKIAEFVVNMGIDFSKWRDISLTGTKKIVGIAKEGIYTAVTADAANADFYKRLFFGILFLAYVEGQKGDVALGILTDDTLADSIIVPPYIKEGLEWLEK